MRSSAITTAGSPRWPLQTGAGWSPEGTTGGYGSGTLTTPASRSNPAPTTTLSPRSPLARRGAGWSAEGTTGERGSGTSKAPDGESSLAPATAGSPQLAVDGTGAGLSPG